MQKLFILLSVMGLASSLHAMDVVRRIGNITNNSSGDAYVIVPEEEREKQIESLDAPVPMGRRSIYSIKQAFGVKKGASTYLPLVGIGPREKVYIASKGGIVLLPLGDVREVIIPENGLPAVK